MPTYTLTGRITPEHTLEVEIPRDAPVGEASVVVTVASTDKDGPGRGSAARLLKKMAEWEKEPPSTRTDEEIEAYIQENRNAWD